MKTFNYLLGVLLAERILTPTDNLSKSLQRTDISAEEGQFLCKLAVKTFESEKNTESFELFWENCLTYVKSNSKDIQEPLVRRARKRPRRYDENNSNSHFRQNAKDHYRQHYFEALDTVRNCIKDRFDQPGYQTYKRLQQLLFKFANSQDYETELIFVAKFYGNDFDRHSLGVQLKMLKKKTTAPSAISLKYLGG